MPIPYTIHEDEPDADLVRVSPPTSAADFHDLKAAQHAPQRNKSPLPYLRSADDHKPNVHARAKVNADAMQEQAKRDVQAALDEATRRIRYQSDRFQQAALPWATRVRDYAEARPIVFTFVAIWVALSAIPIVVFSAFLFSVTAFILGVAAIGICLSVFLAILLGASILLPVLLFTTALAGFALASLIALFLAHRLYLHLSRSTRLASGERQLSPATLMPGLQAWAQETKDRVDFALPRRRPVVAVVSKGADGNGVSDTTPLADSGLTARPIAEYKIVVEESPERGSTGGKDSWVKAESADSSNTSWSTVGHNQPAGTE